jgi:hypothetical protein
MKRRQIAEAIQGFWDMLDSSASSSSSSPATSISAPAGAHAVESPDSADAPDTSLPGALREFERALALSDRALPIPDAQTTRSDECLLVGAADKLTQGLDHFFELLDAE